MGRIAMVSFFLLCFMFSLSLLHQINACYIAGYMPGDAVLSVCPVEWSRVGKTPYHHFVPLEVYPLFDYTLHDADNNVMNMSDPQVYNRTISNAIEYNQDTSGLTDFYGAFSWLVGGGRLVINTLIMPLKGFPDFLTYFWVPAFVSPYIGGVILLLQVLGLYEIITGRNIIG